MKKNYLLYLGLFLIIIGCSTLLLILKDNKKEETKKTIVTIDINPSIELTIDDKEKVIDIKALNEDAKKIVSEDLKNKELNQVFEVIVEKTISNHYLDRGNIVLVNVDGEIEEGKITSKLQDIFAERHYSVEIVIPKITKEDEKLAKKYNITPAKAAYINEVAKSNENIKIENLIDRPVYELKEIKERGRYCEDGYFLEGDFCYKEIETQAVSTGPVCPDKYFDADGTCYRGYSLKEKEGCSNGQELKNGKCVGERVEDALIKYSCAIGELTRRSEIPYQPVRDTGNPEEMMCMDKSTGVAPTQRCLLNSGHIMIDGVCYNGPAPLIDGGCPGPDLPINGWCYSKDDGDQWQCPDGFIYEYSKDTYVELCPDTFTYSTASSSYYCEKGYELQGDKCVTNASTKPEMIRYCDNGYTLYQDRICLDYNDSKDFIEGLVCDYPNSRLEDGKCIIYDIKEALE